MLLHRLLWNELLGKGRPLAIMELRGLCEKGEILFVSHVCKLFFWLDLQHLSVQRTESQYREKGYRTPSYVLFYCCLNNTHLKLRLTEQ